MVNMYILYLGIAIVWKYHRMYSRVKTGSLDMNTQLPLFKA
jgi:hypothetical protein